MRNFTDTDITTNAKTLQSPFIRIVPLCIKDIVVKQFYKHVQDCQSSAGLTNQESSKSGKMEPYLERFDVLMGQPLLRTRLCDRKVTGGFDDQFCKQYALKMILSGFSENW